MTDSSRYEYDWRRRLSDVNMTDSDLTKCDWRRRLGGGGSGDYVDLYTADTSLSLVRVILKSVRRRTATDLSRTIASQEDNAGTTLMLSGVFKHCICAISAVYGCQLFNSDISDTAVSSHRFSIPVVWSFSSLFLLPHPTKQPWGEIFPEGEKQQ